MRDIFSEKFQLYTAKAITILFHPLFMPAYGLLIIFTAPTLLFYLPGSIKKIILLILLINNVLLPLGMILVFRYRNYISSWTMEKNSERIFPLLTVSILYFITSFVIIGLSIPLFIKAYFESVSILSLIIFLINFRYRISVHSAGAGALTALVTVLWIVMKENLVWFLVPVLLISGMILAARLKLNAHNPQEVYSGFLVGFSVVSAAMLFLQ